MSYGKLRRINFTLRIVGFCSGLVTYELSSNLYPLMFLFPNSGEHEYTLH